MMRLMVEKVSEHKTQRRFEPITPRIAVFERLIEPLFADARSHYADMLVLGDARDLETDEIAVEYLIELQGRCGLTLHPRNPDPIDDENVVEGRV